MAKKTIAVIDTSGNTSEKSIANDFVFKAMKDD